MFQHKTHQLFLLNTNSGSQKYVPMRGTEKNSSHSVDKFSSAQSNCTTRQGWFHLCVTMNREARWDEHMSFKSTQRHCCNFLDNVVLSSRLLPGMRKMCQQRVVAMQSTSRGKAPQLK